MQKLNILVLKSAFQVDFTLSIMYFLTADFEKVFTRLCKPNFHMVGANVLSQFFQQEQTRRGDDSQSFKSHTPSLHTRV